MMLADGTELWTTTSGVGRPLLLLHGGPGLWDYFGPLVKRIEQAVTAIRCDQRGCGRSTGEGPFTMVQAVDDIEQLRSFYGYDSWHVLGHSWGAELALRYAAAYPSRTAGVVYVAGVGAGEGYRAGFKCEFERRLGTDLSRFRELEARECTEDEQRELTIMRWTADYSPSSDTKALARDMWDRRLPNVQLNHRANRELWADRLTVDLLSVAPTIELPVTIIQGRDDPRPWQAVDQLAALLPNMRRHIIDGAGHLPWVEKPAETTGLILAAVAQLT